jgi:hypothetical protein
MGQEETAVNGLFVPEVHSKELRRPRTRRRCTRNPLGTYHGPGVFLEDIDGISCARRGKSWRGDGQSFRSG